MDTLGLTVAKYILPVNMSIATVALNLRNVVALASHQHLTPLIVKSIIPSDKILSWGLAWSLWLFRVVSKMEKWGHVFHVFCFIYSSLVLFLVPGIEHRTLCLQGRCRATELNP